MVGIAIITGGIGAYVEAAAGAAWGAAAGFAASTAVEAATPSGSTRWCAASRSPTDTPVLPEHLARLSPVAHGHVIPSGTYHFERASADRPVIVRLLARCLLVYAGRHACRHLHHGVARHRELPGR